jgi:hypothetical protein
VNSGNIPQIMGIPFLMPLGSVPIGDNVVLIVDVNGPGLFVSNAQLNVIWFN